MPAVHQSKRRISKSLSNSPNRPRTRRISVLRSLFSSKPLSQSNNVQWWGGGARRRGWSRRGPTSREAHTVRCAPTKPALRFADVHRSSSSSRAYPVPKAWYACSVVCRRVAPTPSQRRGMRAVLCGAQSRHRPARPRAQRRTWEAVGVAPQCSSAVGREGEGEGGRERAREGARRRRDAAAGVDSLPGPHGGEAAPPHVDLQLRHARAAHVAAPPAVVAPGAHYTRGCGCGCGCEGGVGCEGGCGDEGISTCRPLIDRSLEGNRPGGLGSDTE